MHITRAVTLAVVFLLFTLIVINPASAENSWAQKAPMQQARGQMGVTVVNGNVYAIGGCNQTQISDATDIRGANIVGTNEEYNPAMDVWTFKTRMPEPMSGFAIATYGDKIYCFGSGLNQVYDTTTDTWEGKTPMPTDRSGIQANVLGDKIYITGGQVPIDTYPWENETNINEVYDPQTDTWTTKAPMPSAVEGYSSATFGGKLYVFGGGKAYLNLTLGNITQIYDPNTDSWSYGATSPLITNFAQAGVTTGVNAPPKIYLFNAGILSKTPAQIYDPSSNTWTIGVTQPTSRTWFSLAVVDDLIYAIGGLTLTQSQISGSNISPLALNEVFTPFGYGTVHNTPTPSTTAQPSNTEQTSLPQPTTMTALLAATVIAAVVITVGLVTYFKRRHP